MPPHEQGKFLLKLSITIKKTVNTSNNVMAAYKPKPKYFGRKSNKAIPSSAKGKHQAKTFEYLPINGNADNCAWNTVRFVSLLTAAYTNSSIKRN